MQKATSKPLKILITGASGLVGSALYDYLSTNGHEVYRLVRKASSNPRDIYWSEGKPDLNCLETLDAVVHLAGENIAARRWTAEQKQEIYKSRIFNTRVLVEQLSKLNKVPSVLISASAIGFYGNRGDLNIDESTTQADDFLGRTCRDWEDAANQAINMRVVNARFGIILASQGGALAKMLPIFKLGLGGILGDGKQWMSWIALADVVAAIHHCIVTESLRGPVNFVSPCPLRNSDFTKILAKVLKRPALFPAPKLALRLALGEMADALLLSSAKVEARRLQESGYKFLLPELEMALKKILD